MGPHWEKGKREPGTGEVFGQALTLKEFVLQVRGTANSRESGDLSTHVAGEGCEPWGQGGDPRAKASVSVELSLGSPWTLSAAAAAATLLTWNYSLPSSSLFHGCFAPA